MVKKAKGSKVISTKEFPGGAVRGGKGHMFGKDSAGPQKSGVTEKSGKGGGRWGKGGSGHMIGQGVTPSKAGRTSR